MPRPPCDPIPAEPACTGELTPPVENTLTGPEVDITCPESISLPECCDICVILPTDEECNGLILVLDLVNGLIYAISEGASPPVVTRFDSGSLLRTAALDLDASDAQATSASLSDQLSRIYIGINDTPGAVVAVAAPATLDGFDRYQRLDLSADVGPATAVASFDASQITLVATGDSPAKVIRLNSADFSRTGALDLAGFHKFFPGPVFGGHAYFVELDVFGTNTFIRIVKIKVPEFTHVGTITYTPTTPDGPNRSWVADASGNAYLLFPGLRLVKVDLNSMAVLTEVTMTGMVGGHLAIDSTAGLLYVAGANLAATQGKIRRFNTSDLSVFGSDLDPAGYSSVGAPISTPINGKLYFAAFNTPLVSHFILEVDTTSFTVTDSFNIPGHPLVQASIGNDGSILYYTTRTSPANTFLHKLTVSPLAVAASIDTGQNSGANQGSISGGSIHISDSQNDPFDVKRFRLSDFTLQETRSADPSDDQSNGQGPTADSQGNLYFGCQKEGRIVRFGTAQMAQLTDTAPVRDSITAGATSAAGRTAFFDKNKDNVYVSGSDGTIRKIDLAAFGVVADTLAVGIGSIRGAVLDSANNVAYLVSDTDFARINLDDFTVTTTAAHGFTSAAVPSLLWDDVNDFLYAAQSTTTSFHRVDPDTLAITDTLALDAQDKNIIDIIPAPQAGFAYITTDQNNTSGLNKLIKIDLSGSMTRTAAISLGYAGAANIIGVRSDIMYIASDNGASADRLLQVDLTNFAGGVQTDTALTANDKDVLYANVLSDGNFWTIGSNPSPNVVVRTKIDGLVTSSTSILVGDGSSRSLAGPDNDGCFYLVTSVGTVKICSPSELGPGESIARSMIVDTVQSPAVGYIGTNTGFLVEIDPDTGERTRSLALGTAPIYALTVGGTAPDRFVYAVDYASPSTVYKVDPTTLMVTSQLMMQPGYDLVRAAVTDTAAAFVYMLTDTTGSQIIKLQTSDMITVVSVNSGQNNNRGIAFDTNTDTLYTLSYDCPAVLCRWNVSPICLLCVAGNDLFFNTDRILTTVDGNIVVDENGNLVLRM